MTTQTSAPALTDEQIKAEYERQLYRKNDLHEPIRDVICATVRALLAQAPADVSVTNYGNSAATSAATPEPQEPIAEVVSHHTAGLYDELPIGTKLYAAPVAQPSNASKECRKPDGCPDAWKCSSADRGDCGAVAQPSNAINQTVDWLGLALDIESQAKRVESQTVERAMLAAAHGLRLMVAQPSNAGSRALMDTWTACAKDDLEARRRVAEALGLGRNHRCSFTWEYLLTSIRQRAADDDRPAACNAAQAAQPVEAQALALRNAVLEEAARVAEGGHFLHKEAPTAKFGRECAAAIRRLKSPEVN
jgi:hypothetical protein